MDGTGQQIKTSEITWDDESQTSTTETKYYLRSSVLGGQVLTELSDLESRSYVYAGLAKLAWQTRSIYGAQFVFFEHSDPSGASARTFSEQEFDPLGADTRNPPEQYVPDEGALLSYGDSYNAANPAVAYTVDGIRVSADDFIARGGFLLQEKFGLLEAAARQDANPIGYRFSGVNQGLSFNASYDTNWNRQNLKFGNFDVEGWGTGYRGDIETLYGNSSGLLGFLTKDPQTTQWQRVDVAGIRKNLQTMLNTGDCGEFVENLIDQLAAKTKNPLVSDYALDLFDTVASQGGFVRGGEAARLGASAAAGGQLVYGKGKKPGNGTVYLVATSILDPRILYTKQQR
jgi:hypothetical protein